VLQVGSASEEVVVSAETGPLQTMDQAVNEEITSGAPEVAIQQVDLTTILTIWCSPSC
jgi:hypothetical protein